ncbi:hypothetical protein AMTRI_Chr05g57910 [Amborella trichopoda]
MDGGMETQKECCICGDWGNQKELFKCQTCLLRFQHRYCSRLYMEAQKSGMNQWTCEWCLHERESNNTAPQTAPTFVSDQTKAPRKKLTKRPRYKSLVEYY